MHENEHHELNNQHDHDDHHEHHNHSAHHDHHAHHDHQEITAEALLKHMADHNESHLHELEHVGEKIDGDAKNKLLEAMEYYKQGNLKLREVIDLL